MSNYSSLLWTASSCSSLLSRCCLNTTPHHLLLAAHLWCTFWHAVSFRKTTGFSGETSSSDAEPLLSCVTVIGPAVSQPWDQWCDYLTADLWYILHFKSGCTLYRCISVKQKYHTSLRLFDVLEWLKSSPESLQSHRQDCKAVQRCFHANISTT